MNLKKPFNADAADSFEELQLALMLGVEALRLGESTLAQASFVESDALPIRITDRHRQVLLDANAILQQAGFKFFGPIEGDELFQFVTLPIGWTKEADDNYVSTIHIIDQKGRRRGLVDFCGVKGHRRASLRLLSQYNFEVDINEGDSVAFATVKNAEGIAIYTSPTLEYNDDGTTFHRQCEAAQLMAEKWLTENFPDWRNYNAYWD